MKPRPPATLDPLRALLNEAAVPRRLLPHEQPLETSKDRAAALGLPFSSVAHTQIVDAAGDFFIAIIPCDCVFDLIAIASAIGARRVRISGAEEIRRRFGYDTHHVPLVTGLPTLLDLSFMAHEYVFGSTGDPCWTLRLTPTNLQRATGAIVAPIIKRMYPKASLSEIQ